ncbi:hypothetical protein Calkro_0652 [Caldicellulosiruptor kronotskyensis 2002]|uniref:Uncharacterized protein n=1 Tax=Caldicellulosiruptor kronotskyensis (strain DSM 18902 / VKM B-2412 / 2002) TaxID=632348 RepID=E4SEQ9_CALK2|nr:hypothetical protein [Caldicellulosiruptor kronotskyensis]ADQ45546.1 hypothetical protein Calkro_0652 [Caldicellulosiruptor kronotskyensis 2002]
MKSNKIKSRKIAIIMSEEEIIRLLGFLTSRLSFMPLCDDESIDDDYVGEMKKIINKLAQTVGVELKFENGRIIEAKKDGRTFFRAI